MCLDTSLCRWGSPPSRNPRTQDPGRALPHPLVVQVCHSALLQKFLISAWSVTPAGAPATTRYLLSKQHPATMQPHTRTTGSPRTRSSTTCSPVHICLQRQGINYDMKSRGKRMLVRISLVKKKKLLSAAGCLGTPWREGPFNRVTRPVDLSMCQGKTSSGKSRS